MATTGWSRSARRKQRSSPEGTDDEDSHGGSGGGLRAASVRCCRWRGGARGPGDGRPFALAAPAVIRWATKRHPIYGGLVRQRRRDLHRRVRIPQSEPRDRRGDPRGRGQSHRSRRVRWDAAHHFPSWTAPRRVCGDFAGGPERRGRLVESWGPRRDRRGHASARPDQRHGLRAGLEQAAPGLPPPTRLVRVGQRRGGKGTWRHRRRAYGDGHGRLSDRALDQREGHFGEGSRRFSELRGHPASCGMVQAPGSGTSRVHEARVQPAP